VGCEKKGKQQREPQNFQEFRPRINYDEANGEEFLVIRMFCCGGNTRTLNDFICASARSFTSGEWRGRRKLRRAPRNLIKFSLANEKIIKRKIGSRREAKRELNLMPRRLPVTQKINPRSFSVLSRVETSGIVGKFRSVD
jgi:hypothetical protein